MEIHLNLDAGYFRCFVITELFDAHIVHSYFYFVEDFLKESFEIDVALGLGYKGNVYIAMMSPKPSRKGPNNFNCKVEGCSNFLELEEERLHFLPCGNVDALADLVELENLFLYFQVVYHLGFLKANRLIV